MIKEAIVKIVNKEDLSYREAYDVMNEIMSGETTPPRMQPFLRHFQPKVQRQRQQMRSQAVQQP